MKDLEKLLATVESLDPEKRSSEESPPTDEELVEAREGLVEALKAAAEGDSPDLEAARSIRFAIDAIDAEKVTRTEAKEAAKKEAEELLKGLDASEEGGDEGEGKGDEEEGEEPKPETVVEEEKTPATVAASLLDSLKRTDKKVKAKAQVEEAKPVSDVMVASTGVAQGYGLSQNANLDDVAELFTRYAPQVKRGSSVLVHMDYIYPEERSLGNSATENTQKIDSVTDIRAITAAGGICEPLPADFSHPICGDRGRPIKNALTSFRADRGGVRFGPSATVADLEDAITVWTAATDAAPSAETKACPRVDCEAELSSEVDAVVACLTVGNFQARFNPEFWRSRLDLLMVAHDRIAEQTLYATMLADPVTTTTLVPAGAGDGTVVDLLRVVQMQVAGIKDRHRLIGTSFVSILPAGLQMALRTHLANQIPSGTLDQFSIADAQLNQFFSSLRVRPVWSPDIELIGAQAGGAALAAYNTPFNVMTFPEGTFLFLDGGTLDLGTNIADSTLNATNDRQAFLETFEQVVGRGCEALVTPVAVAADCICA